MVRLLSSVLLSLAALSTAALGADLSIPACPSTASLQFSVGIPDLNPSCPLTQVNLCYTSTALQLNFIAYNETNFYYDSTQGTNGDIWAYEVVEAFIQKGSADPQTYFEYEANPNNVTYNAFVYNPSRTRAAGAPFDHAFVSNPFGDGFAVNTVLDKTNKVWSSYNTIPLALFNGENPQGTTWRMNFFRTVTSPSTYPSQQLCGWKNTNAYNFHVTSAFGVVAFV
ncbi:hypothetical protein GQ54DRAFT_300208 [Martensiomyces pterosporus]|nr:hypothetical protein GQ54DRAFT_300208 [Martensiomyces pterosporus]